MGGWRIRLLLVLGSLILSLLGLACSTSKPTATPTASVQGIGQTAQTTSYRIELLIGAAPITMPAADQFQDAAEGEVMGLMAHMSMTDQGRSVNRHVQVHIYDKRTGSRVTDVTPTVKITARPTGTSRELSNVMACLLARHKVFPHFGDNLYLPNGKYTFTIIVGKESASFEAEL